MWWHHIIKKREQDIFLLIIFIVFISASILFGVTFTTDNVIGANLTNESVITRVNVTNTEPNLYSVAIIPSTIDLNPGGTYNVTCNGSVYDPDGWDDIMNVSATLYDASYGDGTVADNNFRYINGSCTNSSGDGPNCVMKDGQQNNASCVCVFRVWYYANNGTWNCNMTVRDSFALNSTNWTTNGAYMNTVLGIEVPDLIDFGNLSVTDVSDYIRENVTNWGNVIMNVSVRGYGDNNETKYSNQSMVCNIGNISSEYMRYAINNETLFENMYNISNISTKISGLTIPIRTNDTAYGNSTNATFWKLEIPRGVGGACNGTVQFTAVDAS